MVVKPAAACGGPPSRAGPARPACKVQVCASGDCATTARISLPPRVAAWMWTQPFPEAGFALGRASAPAGVPLLALTKPLLHWQARVASIRRVSLAAVRPFKQPSVRAVPQPRQNPVRPPPEPPQCSHGCGRWWRWPMPDSLARVALMNKVPACSSRSSRSVPDPVAPASSGAKLPSKNVGWACAEAATPHSAAVRNRVFIRLPPSDRLSGAEAALHGGHGTTVTKRPAEASARGGG